MPRGQQGQPRVELTLAPIIARLRRRMDRTQAEPQSREDRVQQSRQQPANPEPASYSISLPAHVPEGVTRSKPARPGWQTRIGRVAGRVTSFVVIARAIAVVDIAGKAGVGLFASSLAYTTIFAMVPVLLLLSGVLGWIVQDPAQQRALIEQLVSYLPPLEGLFQQSLQDVVAARGALSVIGLIGLLWGASAFYGSLDEVMRRLFGGGARNEISRRVRGVLTVLILVALVVGTVSLSSTFAILNDVVDDVAIWGYVVWLITMLVFMLVVLAVYLFVPTAPPSLREAIWPALAAGIGIGLLTNLFGLLTPYLIGSLSGFGVIATVFSVLVWLNFSYQMLLFGAAWARLRRDRHRAAAKAAG